MQKVGIKDMQFVLENKKQILLQGINVVCKEKEKGYFYPNLPELFDVFRKKGFNLIRFGIFWDGVEPEPGKYDNTYLNRVKEVIKLAEENQLYVILDMHQDLYAQKYADGAPDWATLDEGAYHPESCISWYDAYLQSDAIIQAADRFWENYSAPDGVGLIDHYANMWEMLAQVFDGCDNIIGFEPMNEPFMGSLARNAFSEAEMEVKKTHPKFDLMNPETMTEESGAIFETFISEKFLEFDRTTLMNFYKKIQKAICRHSGKPLITGGNIYCSSTFRTGISRLEEGSENQVYAPHGYDAVVDSDRYESFSKENVERLFADKRDSQLEMRLPVVIGEWGAFPSKDFTNELIRHMNGILEKYLWSSAYWVYAPGMEQDENYNSLSRAYPMEIAGVLETYHYDESVKCLQMAYEAEKNGASRIYCPYIPTEIEAGASVKYDLEHLTVNACIVTLTVEESAKIEVTIKG